VLEGFVGKRLVFVKAYGRDPALMQVNMRLLCLGERLSIRLVVMQG
jgi:hypothetical protein